MEFLKETIKKFSGIENQKIVLYLQEDIPIVNIAWDNPSLETYNRGFCYDYTIKVCRNVFITKLVIKDGEGQKHSTPPREGDKKKILIPLNKQRNNSGTFCIECY